MIKIKYCLDCNNKIDYRSNRCRSCSKQNKNHPLYGIRMSNNTKNKLRNSIYHKNISGENNPFYKKHHSLETLLKMSEIKSGIKHPNYGKKLSKITCEKISNKITKYLSNKKNHPNWKGGKSFEEYGPEFDSALKEQVRFRDKYKCRECGCTQLENGKQLDVHHVDYNKRNNVVANLVSLCKRCHVKTNYNREHWKKYFYNYVLSENN